MPTSYISGVLRHQNGKAWAGGQVQVELINLFATNDETVPSEAITYTADSGGRLKIPIFVPSEGTVAVRFTAPDGTSVTANLEDTNYDLEELFSGGGSAPDDIETTIAIIDSRLAPAFATLTDAATITWDFENKPLQNRIVTLGGNRTLDIDNCPNGAAGVLIVKQDGAGGRTLTLPANSLVINDGEGAVTLTSVANAVDVLSFIFDGTSFYWTYGTDFTGA